MYFVLVLTLLCFICVDIVVTFVSCCILVVMCFSTWGSFCFCCFFSYLLGASMCDNYMQIYL